MPKMKTKKAVKKRFKISAGGKVLKSQSFRRHLLGDKSSSRKRRIRGSHLVDPVDVKGIKRCLPYG
ncbi:MAG: 50S ribosomal protein L35 [Candidatus Omnitrophica bacterium]|nr:50S ribosomal protein L35 [Candidatus Omnitrophota bacterium]